MKIDIQKKKVSKPFPKLMIHKEVGTIALMFSDRSRLFLYRPKVTDLYTPLYVHAYHVSNDASIDNWEDFDGKIVLSND